MGFLHPCTFPTFLMIPKDSAVESVDEYLSAKEEVIKRVREHLLVAQNRMTMVANRKRSDRSFEINDYVFLKLQPYRQQSMARRLS